MRKHHDDRAPLATIFPDTSLSHDGLTFTFTSWKSALFLVHVFDCYCVSRDCSRPLDSESLNHYLMEQAILARLDQQIAALEVLQWQQTQQRPEEAHWHQTQQCSGEVQRQQTQQRDRLYHMSR